MPSPTTPPAPPASPPPGSVEDCRAVTAAIRATAPADARDAYNLRGWYQAILAYAVGAHDPAPVYDFWWAVEGHRKSLGRGFYLDLWDLYDKAGPDRAAFRDADEELLRCYVCLINNDFVQVLSPSGDVPTAAPWKRRIADLAAQAAQAGDDTRRLLYSVLNLYAELYSDGVADEGRAEFERQLAAVDAAKTCRESPEAPLLRPQAALAGRADPAAREALVRTLAFVYQSLDHFGRVELPDLAARVAKKLGGAADERRPALLQLFKFWAADCPLFLAVLGDKCGYAFHAPPPPRPVAIPAYHGTDNFVCLVGERNVGKTGFMFASEAASDLAPDAPGAVPKLKVRHVSDEKDAVKGANKAWLEGKPSATANPSLYAQTAVDGLCRFTFYDIPGEELHQKQRHGPSPWLQDHFVKRKPCALLMMFDLTAAAPAVDRYAGLVDLLELHLGAADPRYRDVPIYFVLNKADKLLVGDPGPQRELATILQGKAAIRDGFRFPTLRYETGLRTVEDVLGRFADTPACCRNLAFQHVLSADVTRLAPVVRACLQRGYTNLSFVYTTCLAGKDPTYGAVRALWSDLARFLGDSTVGERKAEYEKAFVTNLDRDMGFAAGLLNNAAPAPRPDPAPGGTGAFINQQNLALTNAALAGPVGAAAGTQGAADFTRLYRNARADLDIDRDLPKESGYHEIGRLMAAYAANKKSLEGELAAAIPALLRELGIPVEKSINDLQPSRYLNPHTDQLQPGRSGSTTVQQFLASDGYKKACAEFEKLFLGAVKKYNEAYPADQKGPNSLRVFDHPSAGPDEALGALRSLGGALWNIDAVGRQQVRFDPRYGSLNTLCPYKDRATTDAEDAALNAFGGGERVGRVVTQHAAEDQWRVLIRLLKHFVPRYPQLAYAAPYDLPGYKPPPGDPRSPLADDARYDLDEYKAAVLNSLGERRMQLDEQAEALATGLLGVWHKVQKADQNPAEIGKQFQAKYLLEMLEHNDFQVDAFLKDPIAFRGDLTGARSALKLAIEAVGVAWNDKATLAAQLAQFVATIPKVDRTLYKLEPGNLRHDGEAVARRLDVAGAVFTHISALVGGRWAGLAEARAHSIPNFALPQLVRHNRDLDDYVRARKFLILRERAQYLEAARWLEGLELNDRQFVQSSLNPETFQGGLVPNAPPEQIAKEFKDGVQALRAKDGLWRYVGPS